MRVAGAANNPNSLDSVCLDELSFARFACKIPIVPVMAERCEPPFVIFRLDYVDLCSWRDSDECYRAGLRRLVEAIGAGLQGEVRYRTWEHRLRPWDFAAFLHEKRRDCCGRQWLFDAIDAWRASSPERALLITGDPGMGKSAIVAEMVHRNPGEQVLAYHCCQADTKETLRPGRFVRSLAAMIASKLNGFAAQLDDPAVEDDLSEARCFQDPASAFEEGILTPLERLAAPAEGVRYLLIDALDEALTLGEGLTIVDVLAARRERLPGWLRLVATTRKEPSVLDRLRGLRAYELDAHDPRNLEDLDAYLALRLGQPNLAERLVQSRHAAPDAARVLRSKSAGNFLWVHQALQGIERDLFGFDQLDELPPGLHALYLRQFERLFPDEARFEPARHVLQVVVAAAASLTTAELAPATGLDPEEALPQVFRTLASYVPGRRGRYEVFHTSLADWLTHPDREGTPYFINRRRGHERLADLGWSEFRRDPRALSRYTLAHLPAHLAAAGRLAELANLLCDPVFLESKAEAGLVLDLVRDFAEAVESIPLKHPCHRIVQFLGQAVGMDISFIARHPRTLFDCLWNRCWWYDSSEAMRHYDPPPRGWPAEGPPWAQSEPKLCTLMEQWSKVRDHQRPNGAWIRSLRPPDTPLGGSQQVVIRGHESRVNSVAFDLTGGRLASGSDDGTVRVWDAATGAELACLHGHVDGVWSVAFDPTGRRLASSSSDHTVRVWDAATGAELACLRGHERSVWSVAYDPTGRRLASGSDDGTVRVWDAATGAELACLRGHKSRVNSVAFDLTGGRLASASGDQTVRVWDAATGAELACLCGHESRVKSVAFDLTGGRLDSGSVDGTVRVWDAATGAEIVCLRGHKSWVLSVAFDSIGKRLASSSSDYTVRVWDAATGAEIACLRGHESWVHSVAFDSTGRRLASGSLDRTVRVWDAATGAEPARLREHEDCVTSVAFDPSGRRLASGSSDHTVRVWDAATGAEIVCLRGHEGRVGSVAFDFAGRRLASGSDDGTGRVWDAATGAELACLRGHMGWVWSVAFDPTGRRLASGSSDHTVRVWDVATGAETACLREQVGGVSSVAFDPTGRRLASGSQFGTVRVWDSATGAELACVRGQDCCVSSLAFDRSGRRLASGSDDGTVRVWDAESWERLESLPGGGYVSAIAAGVAGAFTSRAMVRGLETVIETAVESEGVAWFSPGLHCMTTHPTGRLWAGSAGSHLYLIRLEGRLAADP